MLRIEGYRTRNGEKHPLMVTTNESALDALTCLMVDYLQFGGNVTDASDDRVETETQTLDIVDHTIISGACEEMLPVYRVAVAYETAITVGSTCVIAKTCPEVLESMSSSDKPRILSVVSSALLDSSVESLTMLCAFFDFGIEDEAVLQRLTQLSLNDQCAVFVLLHEHPDVSVAKLIELAEPAA